MIKLTTGAIVLALMALSSQDALAQAPGGSPSTPNGLQRLDLNGDGELGWRERQVGKLARERANGASHEQGRRAGRGDGQARERLRERFDTNKDGKLDKAERAEMRKAAAQRRGEGRQDVGQRGQNAERQVAGRAPRVMVRTRAIERQTIVQAPRFYDGGAAARGARGQSAQRERQIGRAGDTGRGNARGGDSRGSIDRGAFGRAGTRGVRGARGGQELRRDNSQGRKGNKTRAARRGAGSA